VKTRKDFKQLNSQIIESKYATSKRRLIIIDEKGVIPFVKYADGTRQPAQAALNALKALSSIPENIVILDSFASKE